MHVHASEIEREQERMQEEAKAMLQRFAREAQDLGVPAEKIKAGETKAMRPRGLAYISAGAGGRREHA